MAARRCGRTLGRTFIDRLARRAALYAEIGRKGGEAKNVQHGPDFYSRIGKVRGEKGRKEKA